MSSRAFGERRWMFVGVAGAIALAVLSCGADGTPAPDLAPEDRPEPSNCLPVRERMPAFFALIEREDSPLSGLGESMASVVDGGSSGANPVGEVMGAAMKGLKSFIRDPNEDVGAQCLTSRPERPLCSVEAVAGELCENRFCAMRRALDFGIRQGNAADAIASLRPLLGTLLGYFANHGPGADGEQHLGGTAALQRAASPAFEAICHPRDAALAADGLIVFLRARSTCGVHCSGRGLLEIVGEIAADPALQPFLETFEISQSEGKGREAIQRLGALMTASLANTPEDEHYFDDLQLLLDQVGMFLDTDPDTYANLRLNLNELSEIMREMMDPRRPGAVLPYLKSVAACSAAVDPDGMLAGDMYDLLRRPGGVKKGGLDLKDLVGALDQVGNADTEGVLTAMAHAVLASMATNEQALEAMRRMVASSFSVENAALALPALQELVASGAIEEAVGLLNDLLYGCRAVP